MIGKDEVWKERRKYDARSKRRRRRRIRRVTWKPRADVGARSRAKELIVCTLNVRTVTFKHKNGIGHGDVVLTFC